MKTIKIKYFAPITPITPAPQGDWVDLRAAEDMDIPAGEYRIIRLGVAMQLPAGYEGHMAPRSSTFKNWHVLQTNSVAVIDNSFCGDNDEWRVCLYATQDTHIAFDDRIVQFRIIEKQPELRFETVETLGNADRGGFGSTGRV